MVHGGSVLPSIHKPADRLGPTSVDPLVLAPGARVDRAGIAAFFLHQLQHESAELPARWGA